MLTLKMPYKLVHGGIVHGFVKMRFTSDSKSYLYQNTLISG